jgi:hypothetical protein
MSAQSDLGGLAPMSEEDYEREKTKLFRSNPDAISTIINNYFMTVKNLMTTVQKKISNDKEIDETDSLSIDRLKRLVNLCPPEEIFIRSKEKIWAVRMHIVNKNADYFMKKDYSGMIKKDEKQTMLESLIIICKSRYNQMSAEEKEIYWMYANELLKSVIQYKKLTISN